MYKPTRPPCYKCTKRYAGCHSKCQEYISWNTERKEFLETRREAILSEQAFEEAAVRKNIRNMKKKRRY